MQRIFNDMKDKMLRCAHFLFVGMFAILSFEIIISLYGKGSIFRNTPILLFVFYAFIVGACIVLFCKYLRKSDMERRVIWKQLFLWGIWIMIQTIYIGSTWSHTNSDAGVIGTVAYQVANGEEMLQWVRTSYFPSYPNNIVYCMLLTGFHTLFSWAYSFDMSWLVTAALAGLLADLAIYWTVKLTDKVCGKSYHTLTFIVACLFIGLSEEASILYSDICVLWTIPCGLYFMYKIYLAQGEKNYRAAILAGSCLGFGFTLKPQVVILPIAFSIVFLLKTPKYRKVMISYSMFLIAFLLLRGTLNYAGKQWFYKQIPSEYDAEQYIEDRELSMLHFVNMGLNSSTLGVYSLTDVQKSQSILGKQEKTAMWLKEIKSRVLEKGWGIIAFWNKKVLCAIQNGTFSQELVWKGEILSKGGFTQQVAKYFVSTDEKWKNGLGAFIQTCYMFVLLFTVVGALRRSEVEAIILTSEVSLIGIILFLILFECNIRYFYTMLPCLILLSIKSLEECHVKREVNKISEVKES